LKRLVGLWAPDVRVHKSKFTLDISEGQQIIGEFGSKICKSYLLWRMRVLLSYLEQL